MKYLVIASLIVLSGCQMTIAKLPSPDAPATVVQEHAQVLKVLVDDYNKRVEKR